MTLRHPRRPEPEPVRENDLLEEILEHHPLRRDVTIDLRLRDGEEDVELHGRIVSQPPAYNPSRCPLTKASPSTSRGPCRTGSRSSNTGGMASPRTPSTARSPGS